MHTSSCKQSVMAGMFCIVWEGRARLRVVDWEEDMKGGKDNRKEGGRVGYNL